jgi:hypothetical protein
VFTAKYLWHMQILAALTVHLALPWVLEHSGGYASQVPVHIEVCLPIRNLLTEKLSESGKGRKKM